MLNILRPFYPIRYQGEGKGAPYFEGWYFKHTQHLASPERENRTYAFVPGIARSAEGRYAFVQVIDGAGKGRYFRYPPEDFSVRDEPFEIRLGENRFSLSGLSVRLQDEAGSISADLSYGPRLEPRHWPLSPGVMGPFSFVPGMECYHGIASMDHEVSGYVQDGERFSFDGGRGYIEKDWGRSMPQTWIWMQTNDFPSAPERTSFSLSLARVPWGGSYFNGFIALLQSGGREFRFATYTGARLELLEHQGTTLRLLLSGHRFKLEVLVRASGFSLFAAPRDGTMDRRIGESADSWARVVLKSRHGNSDLPLFDFSSSCTSLETVGDIASLRP